MNISFNFNSLVIKAEQRQSRAGDLGFVGEKGLVLPLKCHFPKNSKKTCVLFNRRRANCARQPHSSPCIYKDGFVATANTPRN